MEVTVPCHCDTPHDTDTITLRDRLNFLQATTITKAVAFIEEEDPAIRPAVVLATLTQFYVLMGVESWTLTDGRGGPLPVTTATIQQRVLAFDDVSAPVAEAADGLYQEQVLLPLVQRAANSSRPSPTRRPTSRKSPGGRQRSPKPSKPSLTSITPTGGTGTTSSSLAGVSSFSPSSESAAG